MILNEKGSTLIENIISIFLLSVLSIMVVTSLMAALNTLQRLRDAKDEMYSVYTDIEADEANGASAVTNSEISASSGDVTLSFKINGADYSIIGESIYDSKNLLGEFYRR